MAIVDMVYWLAIFLEKLQLKPLGNEKEGWWLLSTVLYSSHELSQWLCHNDSTINIVLVIIVRFLIKKTVSILFKVV